jgi:hypothetical protein
MRSPFSVCTRWSLPVLVECGGHGGPESRFGTGLLFDLDGADPHGEPSRRREGLDAVPRVTKTAFVEPTAEFGGEA